MVKLTKPTWVNHEEGNPIYSIDIHPDRSRFATGGMCGDSGRVCVWNMGPVVDEAQEKRDAIPKMLCRMDNHLACVNCVRWSISGKYLASGGDDKIIMIWQHSGGSGSSFGGITNAEQWRSVSTLRGHAMEVLDVAWSPNDCMMASASPDNTILIWNTERWGDIIATLRGHTGLVKGVVWDPIGKYVASQADDKSLRVWRTSDWKEETKVTEPFAECGGTTHVLRLGWSPDGQFLVSAHAMNNLGSTAQIIDRDSWNAEKDFVGHRKAVTCVRFSNNIFTKKVLIEKKAKNGQRPEMNGHSTDYAPKKTLKCVCLAMGSRDRSLSVWVTHLQRPLLVMHDMFENTIMDLSWSTDGHLLMACSSDGSVALIEFNETELGTALTQEEKIIYYEKLYGRAALVDPRKTSKTPDLDLIEDPELLRAQEECEKSNKASAAYQNSKKMNGVAPSASNDSRSQMSSGSTSRSPTSKNPTDRQIETKMPDGRRRITPLFIPPSTGTDGVPKPFVSADAENIISSSSACKSKIVVEHVDLSNDKDSFDKNSAKNAKLTSSPTTNRVEHSEGVQSTPASQTKPQKSVTIAKDKEVNLMASIPIKPAEPIAVKRKQDKADLFTPPAVKKKPGRPVGSASSSQQKNQSAQGTQQTTQDQQQQQQQSPNQKQISERLPGLVLPCLNIEKSVNVPIIGTLPLKCVWAENCVAGSPLNVIRMTRSQTGSSLTTDLWRVIMASRIRSVNCSTDLIVCTCDDLTMHLFNAELGNRITPPLMLDCYASKLFVAGFKVLLISSRGKLWMWDFNMDAKRRLIVKCESLDPLFIHSPNCYLSSCSITESGWPVLNFSNGRSFVYDDDCGTWTLIADEGDSLAALFSSSYATQVSQLAADQRENGDSLSAFTSIHWKSTHYMQNRALKHVISSNAELWRESAISYCDRQLASCQRLNSSKEYRFWLLELAKLLTESSGEYRLKNICQSLVTLPGRRKGSQSEINLLHGNSKDELLTEILRLMSKNVRLQRLYTEFKDMIGYVSTTSHANYYNNAMSQMESSPVKSSGPSIQLINSPTYSTSNPAKEKDESIDSARAIAMEVDHQLDAPAPVPVPVAASSCGLVNGTASCNSELDHHQQNHHVLPPTSSSS